MRQFWLVDTEESLDDLHHQPENQDLELFIDPATETQSYNYIYKLQNFPHLHSTHLSITKTIDEMDNNVHLRE